MMKVIWSTLICSSLSTGHLVTHSLSGNLHIFPVTVIFLTDRTAHTTMFGIPGWDTGWDGETLKRMISPVVLSTSGYCDKNETRLVFQILKSTTGRKQHFETLTIERT